MKNEIAQYENYLYQEEETERSITEHLLNLEMLKNWCVEMQLDKEQLTRNVLLNYVQYMQSHDLKVGTQNTRLNSLEKYYDYLKAEGVINQNPIKGFRVRNDKKKVVKNSLTPEELKQLYHNYEQYLEGKPHQLNYPQREVVNLRMKLVVSLIVFQGLHTGELDKLTVEDVNPKKATLYVPSTARSNSRVIALDPSQIIPFYEYLNTLPPTQEKLFATKIQKGFHYTMQELKGINPMVRNVQHLRASVLLNWIKQHGKRKAQYMIGHRYVSSTEKYVVQDTSDLSKLMETTHLFG